MKLKRILSALLAAALLLTAVGCTELDQNGQPLPTDNPTAESARFDEYLMDIFREEIGSTAFDCRFIVKDPAAYGITDVPLIVDSIDFDEYDNSKKYWQEDYDELNAYNYEALTEDQQLIYDLMVHDYEVSKDVQELKYLYEYNSPLLGMQSQLPSLLPEYELYTVQDAYDYITMLEHLPEYFEDMLEFQRRKSAKGLFMSDSMADELIRSCKNVITDTETNGLITTFPERLTDLPNITKEDTDKLIELNRKAFIDEIVPAYEAFITGIEGLKGTGVNEGGLCGYEGGKKYYEYLVKSGTGSDRAVSEIAKMIDDRLDKAMSIIAYTAKDDPESIEKFFTYEADYGSPQDIMKRLEKETVKDFPQVAELSYNIKEIAPELEEHSSPAFYIIPQIDDPFNNAIYINNKYLEDDATQLFTTLAHEGYPGHMYQNSYFNATKPHPIRRLLGTQGYSEGWASYVEALSFNMAGIENASVSVLMENFNTQSLLISSRADIGVNYEGWDKVRLKQYLSDFGFDNDEVVESVFNAVVQDPANYLNYSVGMLELQKLRNYAEIELDKDFEAMEFHKAVLDVGSAPFKFTKAAVDEYIASVKEAKNPAKAA